MGYSKQKNTQLTARQQEVLNLIIDQIESQGFPPTVRELRDYLGVSSVRGASIHLDALERKGFISRTGQARGIRVLHRGDQNTNQTEIKIPLLGQIQAGQPLFAEENIEKYINVKRVYLRGHRQAFALRVNGESMIEAGIRPGDVALVTPTQTAHDGDIVVALLGDSATLKKYRRIDDYVALLPANPKFEPIIGREFSIQGKLIGIIRPDENPGGRLIDEAALVPVYRAGTSDHPSQAANSMVKWVYGRTVD